MVSFCCTFVNSKAAAHTEFPSEILLAAGISYGFHVIGWLLFVFSALPQDDVEVLQAQAAPTTTRSIPQGAPLFQGLAG